MEMHLIGDNWRKHWKLWAISVVCCASEHGMSCLTWKVLTKEHLLTSHISIPRQQNGLLWCLHTHFPPCNTNSSAAWGAIFHPYPENLILAHVHVRLCSHRPTFSTNFDQFLSWPGLTNSHLWNWLELAGISCRAKTWEVGPAWAKHQQPIFTWPLPSCPSLSLLPSHPLTPAFCVSWKKWVSSA